VTLTFDDPNLDFETRLRGLIDKVRAQYPDIAFDVENLGAAPEQLQKVRALLKSLDIPLALYNAPVPASGTPSIKLYPR
jgi:ABC-type glycerol-3-phosphate transport system substrate-binding protein